MNGAVPVAGTPLTLTCAEGSSTVPVTETGLENSTFPFRGSVIATTGGGSNTTLRSVELDVPQRSIATILISIGLSANGTVQA
jgi:hypothetical protein